MIRRSVAPPSSLLAVPAMLVSLGLAAFPAVADDAHVRLDVRPAEIRASESLMWSYELIIQNTSEAAGLYLDSLSLRIENMDPGVKPGAKVQDLSMTAFIAGIGSLSSGDSTLLQQSVPATCEKGVITYRLHAHRSTGEPIVVDSRPLRLLPGPVSEAHPSEFLTVGGKKVEIVTFASAKEGTAPGILVVADEGSSARSLFAQGIQLSARGFTAILVSLPGHGLSEGDPDELGAPAAAAISAALDRLAKTPGVDPKRLGAWGISKSAGAVAQVAARRKDLAAVILQSGIYADGAGAGSKAATLILHGEQDAVAPVLEARAVGARLEKSGAKVESRFLPAGTHVLPRGEVMRASSAFLAAQLQP